MRIVSLNVNGLRAFDSKNGNDFNTFCSNILQGDIICLQETKGCPTSLSKYHSLKDYLTLSSYFKKGIYGVSTLIKKNLFCSKSEEIVPGRILKTHHGPFVVFNCYMPYCDETLEKDKTEIIKVYNILQEAIENTQKKNVQIVICGDMNATYNVLDHYLYFNELCTLIEQNKWKKHDDISKSKRLVQYSRGFSVDRDKIGPKMREKYKIYHELIKTEEEFQDDTLFNSKVEKINPKATEVPFHFFTFEALKNYFFEVYQRRWMNNLVENFVDTFRIHNKQVEQYTCWNVLFNLRPINWGSRIDYVLCSKDVECSDSGIMPEIMGSDHCPVFAILNLEEIKDDEKNIVKRKNNLFDYFSK